jgi:hypothetical protein
MLQLWRTCSKTLASMTCKGLESLIALKVWRSTAFRFSYDKNGQLKSKIISKPPNPTRLKFEFSEELVKTIDQAYQDGLKVINVTFNHKRFAESMTHSMFLCFRTSITNWFPIRLSAKASSRRAGCHQMPTSKWPSNWRSIATLVNFRSPMRHA